MGFFEAFGGLALALLGAGLAAALPMLLLFAAAVKAGPDFGAPAERRKDAQ